MYEGFSPNEALERLDDNTPCHNNSLCKRLTKDYPDACFDCVLFDLKEYSAELNGEAIVGEPYGNVDEMKTELAALREKYRWRKQGEEPTPEDIEVLMYDAYRKVFLIDYYCYRPNIDYVFWRPLDLPDEALKE